MLGLWHGPSIGLRAAAALLGEDEDRVADTGPAMQQDTGPAMQQDDQQG